MDRQPPAAEASRAPAERPPAERRLLAITWACLALYVPAETLYSYPYLGSPGYLVDLIGMVLLFTGARHLARTGNPAPLAAAWGWSACLAWRSYFARWHSRRQDLGVYDEPAWVEPIVGLAMAVTLAVFGLSLRLAYRPWPRR